MSQQVKRRNAAVVEDDGFAVDRAARQPRHCLEDQGIALGQILSRPAVEPHPGSIIAGDDADAVQLDLVQPKVAGRRGQGQSWASREV